MSAAPLSERERQMLLFEKGRWQHSGARETAVRELFGCSGIAYAQELLRLIDRPEAYAAEPVLVKRLRRLRDERRAARQPPVRR